MEIPASILLVDDHPPNLLALEAVLADLGQNLVRAGSGPEALERVAAAEFAVIILDVQMPGMDGFETARRLREQERCNNTPLLFLTALSERPEYREEGYALGAVDFLYKPFDAGVLRAKVAALVQLWRANRETQRQVEARPAAIIEAALDAIITIDHQDRVVEWNGAAEGLFGYSRSEALGQSLADLIVPPSLAARHRKALDRYLSTGEAPILGQRLELPGRHADGSEFPVELSVIRLPVEGPPLFTAYLRDLREQKRLDAYREIQYGVTHVLAEAGSLTEAVPRLIQAICRSTHWLIGAFWRVDGEEQVLRCLQVEPCAGAAGGSAAAIERFAAVTRNTALPREGGLPGRAWRSGAPAWIVDVTRDPHFIRVSPAVEAGLHAGFAFPVQIKDEVVGVMEFFSPELREPDTHLLALVKTVGSQIGQFIERREAQEALQERARALAEADHRKSVFISMLSHELRNPLAAVSNALHVMGVAQPGTESFERARKAAVRQVQHQIQMVDDLLDTSRIESGKVRLRSERLDLVSLVRDGVEDRRTDLEAAGLQLVLDLPERPVQVLGDRTRLTQVLDNLLENARKFTPPGGRITVGMTLEGESATVKVTDTGVGIDPETLVHLFEPFAQADRSLDRSAGGLGLGLALVRSLVELHGGHVSAHSSGLGRGAEFSFALPLVAEPSALQEAPALRPAVGSDLRILVIEDNVDAAETLRDLLELFGYTVETAGTGPEGLRKAHAFHPQVILCDIGLPGMSGYEVAGELRRDPETAASRLIAVTGYGTNEDQRRSAEAGFDLHLTKPVDPGTLQQVLTASAQN